MPISPRTARRRVVPGTGTASVLAVAAFVFATSSLATQETDWTELAKSFRRAYTAKDVAGLRSLAGSISGEDDPRAAELLIKYTLAGLDFDLELTAGKALATMERPESRKVIHEAAIRNKNFKTRIILLGVAHYQFSRSKDPRAFQVLLNALSDPRKEVVFAALRWIRAAGDERAVDALIEALARWERQRWGRVYYDIRNTLEHLTGRQFDIADDWRNYWEARKQGIDAPPPKDSGRTKVVNRRFFSVTIDTDRVVFIIDVSGSMEKKDPPPEVEEEEKPEGRTVVVSGKKKKKKKIDPATLPLSRQRLYRVKQELISTIENLPEHVFFTIESFSHKVQFLDDKPGLIQATPANKLRAISWVRKMRPEGETFTDVAFERAFEEIPGMDTIIFLSDGAPRRNNEPIPEDQVLRKIMEANRFSKCRIHAIGFKQSGSNLRRFLTKLARQHDGTFTQLE